MTDHGTQVLDLVQEFTNLLINPSGKHTMTDTKRPRHNLQNTIRMYLRSKAYADGLTLDALVLLINTHRSSINESLNKMPDAYIDRWVKERQGPGRYAAVWCVVVPPENCPPPSRQ